MFKLSKNEKNTLLMGGISQKAITKQIVIVKLFCILQQMFSSSRQCFFIELNSLKVEREQNLNLRLTNWPDK